MESELQKCIKFLKKIDNNFHRTVVQSEYTELFKVVDNIHFKSQRRQKKLRNDNFRAIMLASGTHLKRINAGKLYQNKLEGKRLELLEIPGENVKTLSSYSIRCHVCHQFYFQIHHHYYSLCPKCAAFNYAQRFVTADLSGKISLVTGGRVKIGYEICKKLLRCGSTVIVTTRFPEDALRRYQTEEDYESWKHNLTIVYLDLINFYQVLQFVDWIKAKFVHLDILILNAAQTVSKERKFYEGVLQDYNKSDHVIEWNQRALIYKPESKAMGFNSLSFNGNNLPMIDYSRTDIEVVEATDKLQLAEVDTVAELDEDHQVKEYRKHNTWSERLDDFNMKDFLHILVINLYSPACMVQLLTPLLAKNSSETGEDSGQCKKNDFSFVVLVSAVEGMFKIDTKNTRHPHTNAAKAGLNMFTRTSASDYRNRFNILINSVDTGFVTVETINTTGFVPPLDNEDGMARVLHPIFEWYNKKNVIYGKMMKNFRSVDF